MVAAIRGRCDPGKEGTDGNDQTMRPMSAADAFAGFAPDAGV